MSQLLILIKVAQLLDDSVAIKEIVEKIVYVLVMLWKR